LSLGKQQKIRDKFNVNSTFYSRYTFYDLGYNLRPTEINGFIGNTQLKYIKQIIEARESNFKKLAKRIYTDKRFYPIRFDHIDTISNFAVPIICKSKKIKEALVEKCNGKLEIRPIVGGDIVQQPFFAKYIKIPLQINYNAKLIHENGFYFGNNPDLTAKEIKIIIDLFADL